jgi:hypothetical protein
MATKPQDININNSLDNNLLEIISKNYYVHEMSFMHLTKQLPVDFHGLFYSLEFMEEINTPFITYNISLKDNDLIGDMLIKGSEITLTVKKLDDKSDMIKKKLTVIDKYFTYGNFNRPDDKFIVLVTIDTSIWDVLTKRSTLIRKYSNTTLQSIIADACDHMQLKYSIDSNIPSYVIKEFYFYNRVIFTLGSLIQRFPIHMYYGIDETFHFIWMDSFKDIITKDNFFPLIYINDNVKLGAFGFNNTAKGSNMDIGTNFFSKYTETNAKSTFTEIIEQNYYGTIKYQDNNGAIGESNFSDNTNLNPIFNNKNRYKVNISDFSEMNVTKLNENDFILSENNTDAKFTKNHITRISKKIWEIEHIVYTSILYKLYTGIELWMPNPLFTNDIEHKDNPNDGILKIKTFLGGTKHLFLSVGEGFSPRLIYYNELHLFSNT